MTPCPDDLRLAAVAGGRPGPDREAVLAHAADCPSCRAALAELSPSGTAGDAALSAAGLRAARKAFPRPRRPWIPLAAAASLLLAIPLLRFRTAGRAETPDAPPPGSGAASFPFHSPSPFHAAGTDRLLDAGAADLEFPLGRAVTAVLRRGSRVQLLEETALRVLEGTLWVEAPGEPIRILAGEAVVSAEETMLLVEMPRPAGAAGFPFLREALAGDAAGRLRVLSGAATVRRPGIAVVRVAAGQELLLDAARPSQIPADQPPTWRGDGGWERTPGSLPARLREGRLVLAPPGGEALRSSYVWETRFRRIDLTAGAAVCFEAGGRGWELPLGAPLGEGTGWVRVRVEVRDGWVRVRAGAYEMLSARVETLAGRLETVAPVCGLRAWGGDLEIADSRWRRNR